MPNNAKVVEQLEAPMPWIGTYAAAAAALCTVAMAADVFHGLTRRKYWFPSKYFSLNATSLALLAVSMKLPVDLTTKMYSAVDRLAKVSSLAFMSVATANFLTSLGSTDNKSMIVNAVALGIMVVTITGNVCIQTFQMRSYLSARRAFWEESLAIALMLVQMVMLMSSALTILSTKGNLEAAYQDMRSSALDEEEKLMDVVNGARAKQLRALVEKYWVMAETSSPQFVIARSVTSTVSGVVSLVAAVVLVEAEIRIALKEGLFDQRYSSYKYSTRGILLCQTIGVIVGAVAPASRWFVAVSHGRGNNWENAFTVERYWTRKLVEWRRRSLSVEIHHHKSRKFLHTLNGIILELGVSIQNLIVLTSKLILALSISITRPIRPAPTPGEAEMRRYVIQLEGEADLPAATLTNLFKEVDTIINRAKRRKPKNLMNLLSKSITFEGVKAFDSDPQNLPYCWALPVVTLACIALAIPNVAKEASESLLRGVAEGLRYVKFIDKVLDTKRRLARARAAADAVSVEAELHRRWMNKDLAQISVRGSSVEEILEKLNQDSAKTVHEFISDPKYFLSQNCVNWPPEVIAASAMHRVSKTILLSRGDGETDEELFERLSAMIADIMAACLTNLPRAITAKCHRDAIEERGRGVCKAANYLGETEEIITLLHDREIPSHRAAYVEEWRGASTINA